MLPGRQGLRITAERMGRRVLRRQGFNCPTEQRTMLTSGRSSSPLNSWGVSYGAWTRQAADANLTNG